MRHSVQGTDCHFQHLACALNHSCLQLEPRFFFPVSSRTICCCLRYLGRRAGLAVSDTDTQIPPDSRMNPSSKHPAPLSLGRLLLSAPLVTRFARIIARSASFHISNTASRTIVATFACNKDSLLVHSYYTHYPLSAGPVVEGNTNTNPRAATTLAVAEHRQAGLRSRT